MGVDLGIYKHLLTVGVHRGALHVVWIHTYCSKVQPLNSWPVSLADTFTTVRRPFVLAPLPFPTDLLDKVRVKLNQSKVDAACELVLLGGGQGLQQAAWGIT